MATARPIKAIDAGTSARTALRRLIATGARGFSRHLARMMTSNDIEGPHKTRDDFTALRGDRQDDLGRLNDLAVARARGLTSPDDPQTLAHAQMLWVRLRASPTFWSIKKPEP